MGALQGNDLFLECLAASRSRGQVSKGHCLIMPISSAVFSEQKKLQLCWEFPMEMFVVVGC